MAYFDFLNDKGKDPKVGMSYIYLLDMIWERGKLGDSPIKYGTIVYNVKAIYNNGVAGGFEFNLKDDNKIYRCNYPWAFAENTEENRKNISIWLDKKKELKKIENECNTLYDKVVTLKIKKD